MNSALYIRSLVALTILAACSDDDSAASNCTEHRLLAPDPASFVAWTPLGYFSEASTLPSLGGGEKCEFRDGAKTVLLCATSFVTGSTEVKHLEARQEHDFTIRFRRSPTMEPVGAVLRLGEHFQFEDFRLQLRVSTTLDLSQREVRPTLPVSGDLTLTVERLAQNTVSAEGRLRDVPWMLARGGFCSGAVAASFRTRLTHRDGYPTP